MAQGDKNNPYLLGTIKETRNTKDPDGVTIKRSGNVYTLSWIATEPYAEQKVRFRKKTKANASSDAVWGSWEEVTVTASARTANKTYSVSIYCPSSDVRLTAIQAEVRSKRAVYTERQAAFKNGSYWYYYIKEITCTWSAFVKALYDIKVPSVPAISGATPGNASTAFPFTVTNGDTQLFANCEYQSRLVKDWGTKDASSGVSWTSGTGLKTGTVNSVSDTVTIPEDSGLIGRGNSYTRILRMRSRGASGVSSWAYKSYIYAWPNAIAESAITASKTDISGGYRVTVSFKPNKSDTNPVDQYRVEYCIGTPTSGAMGVPGNASWSVGAAAFASAQAKPSATFNVNQRLGYDEALWVRVVQIHGSMETASAAKFVAFGAVTPVGAADLSVTYDSGTKALTLNCSNPSSIATSMLRIWLYYWANGKWNQHSYVELAHGVSSVTVTKDLNPYAEWAFDTYVGIGNGYWSAYQRIRYNPRSQAVPTAYAPSVGSVAAGSEAGTIVVNWANVMYGVTGAEITVATSATEWSKANPSFVVDSTVSGTDIKSTTVSGLEYGVAYYVKVKTTNANGSSNWSSNTGTITLSASMAPVPVLTLEETAEHYIKVSWNWSRWSQATAINISWADKPDDGKSDYKTNEVTVNKRGNTGVDTYTITDIERGKRWYIQAEFVASTARSNPGTAYIDLVVNPIAPTNLTAAREAQTSDEAAKTSVRVNWTNGWTDSDSTEVTWSTSPSAWEATSGLNSYSMNGADGRKETVLIPNLDMGQTWYFRVKLIYDGKFEIYSDIISLDLSTDPDTPVVRTGASVVAENSHIDISWSYSCEDGGAQAAIAAVILNGSGTEVAAFGIEGDETSFALYPEVYGLTGNNEYQIRIQTVSEHSRTSEWSDAASFIVQHKPIAEITATSLENGVLTELPLTVTVEGAEYGGITTVYVERAETFFEESPGEDYRGGYAGELTALGTIEGSGTVSLDIDALRSPLNDGASYRIVAFVTDDLGKSDPVTLDFVVDWSHKALMPTATRETDPDEMICMITIGEAPEGAEEGDTVDIYRLSADKPELIIQGGAFDETYVDPFPAFGGGYRVVYRTVNGDFTTEDGELAWVDLFGSERTSSADVPDVRLDGNMSVINFGANVLELLYNMEVGHSWAKDFKETKYLGGSVQGDWNPAVSRSTSLQAVSVSDQATSDLIRRLAVWDGICHVRTPEGSSFAADVQVAEDRSYSTAGKIVEYKLNITRVDPEGFEGMTLAEWQGE